MRNQIQNRLKELESEYASGERLLADLQRKEKNLRATLLRLSGAIQVLKEVLEKKTETNGDVELQESESVNERQ